MSRGALCSDAFGNTQTGQSLYNCRDFSHLDLPFYRPLKWSNAEVLVILSVSTEGARSWLMFAQGDIKTALSSLRDLLFIRFRLACANSAPRERGDKIFPRCADHEKNPRRVVLRLSGASVVAVEEKRKDMAVARSGSRAAPRRKLL